MRNVTFNAKQFLEEHFEDVDGVLHDLRLHRIVEPKKDTVRQWFARNSVPSDWLPVLLVILEARYGQPVSLRQNIRIEGE